MSELVFLTPAICLVAIGGFTLFGAIVGPYRLVARASIAVTIAGFGCLALSVERGDPASWAGGVLLLMALIMELARATTGLLEAWRQLQSEKPADD